jgi:hypothetical protein
MFGGDLGDFGYGFFGWILNLGYIFIWNLKIYLNFFVYNRVGYGRIFNE